MEIKNAKVTITLEDPNELIEAMNSEEKIDFFQSLACHDEVIQHVMDQVFFGSTENMSHGSRSCSWEGSTPLDKFTEMMIGHGADLQSKARIEFLERSLKRLEGKNEALAEKLDKIENPSLYV